MKLSLPQLIALWLGCVGGLWVFFASTNGLYDAERTERDAAKTRGRVVDLESRDHGRVVVEFRTESGVKRVMTRPAHLGKVGDELDVYYSKADPSLAFTEPPSEFADAQRPFTILITMLGSFFVVVAVLATAKPEVARLRRNLSPRESATLLAAVAIPGAIREIAFANSDFLTRLAAVAVLVGMGILLRVGYSHEWGWRESLRSKEFLLGLGLVLAAAGARFL